MAGWFSVFFHPLATVNLWLDDDPNGSGIDVLYLLTTFFGFGIWLVFKRYQTLVTRAIDFTYVAPAPASPDWEGAIIHEASIESHLRDPDLLPPSVAAFPSEEEYRYITCFDPSTGLHIGTLPADNETSIKRKINLATEAQKKWKYTTFAERRRVLRSLSKWLTENQEVCARVACRDTGKTLIDAALGEILVTCSKLEWTMKHGEKALRAETRRTNLMLSYKKSQVVYEPLGVVAAVVSWNYPLHNSWSPIIASIFAGNGIILKCSEKVAWSSEWFVGVIQEALRACGYDPDLVQCVYCYPEQVEFVTRSPMIKHITFIGSEDVGRQVAMAAVEHLTPVTLELGGKDPAVILPGTDLERWSSTWMRGVYQNSGQNCIGIERLIVHESQHDELYEILAERREKLRCGSVMAPAEGGYVPTVDCGAMINADRFVALSAAIKLAQEQGAQVEGGNRWNHSYLEHGTFFEPTLVGNVTTEMVIAQHEMFAPIALLMPYRTVDEAIEIANSSRYGLGASVFGPVQSECTEVAEQLECGMVSINDFAVYYVNQDLPFGGTKSSGYGRFGGPEGLRSLTKQKAIVIDLFPRVIQTKIPAVIDYPIRSLVQSWEFATGLVELLYGDSWRTRGNGLSKVWRSSHHK